MNEASSSPKTPMSAVTGGKPTKHPEVNDPLDASKNEEFILIRDGAGKLWAFPRGHLVSAKMKDKTVCELNFRTHIVVFGGNDCTEIFPALLDGSVCAVISGERPDRPKHIRPASRVQVTPTGVESGARSK